MRALRTITKPYSINSIARKVDKNTIPLAYLSSLIKSPKLDKPALLSYLTEQINHTASNDELEHLLTPYLDMDNTVIVSHSSLDELRNATKVFMSYRITKSSKARNILLLTIANYYTIKEHKKLYLVETK